jgi:hypothetical protein
MKTWDEAFDAATTEERKTVRRWKPSKPLRWGSALTLDAGDKNQCPTCGHFFASTYAFDAHRTGPFGTEKNPKSNRRCLTLAEMVGRGMVRNSHFWWVSGANPIARNASD